MSEATTKAALMTEHRDYIDGYAAGLADGRRIAPQPAVPVVPAGFALVPVEPTPEMWQAVDKFAHAGSVWDAMLAASQQKGKQ